MIISAFYSHIMSATRQLNISVSEVAEKCLEHSLTGIDVIYSQVDEQCIKNVEALKKTGMTVCSLPAHSDFIHDGSLDFAEKVVKTADMLGAKVIMAIPGIFNEGDDRLAARKKSLEPIRHMCQISKPLGIHVGVEDYDDICSAVAGLDSVKWYLSEIKDLHCIFDSGNYKFMGNDTMRAYRELKSRIKYQIHCNDRALNAPENVRARTCADGSVDYPAAVGSGVIPNGEILSDLFASGFDGIVTIENFGSPDALSDLCASADFISGIYKK